MRFYTASECEDWLKVRERKKPDTDQNARFERVGYPEEPGRIRYLSQWIASSTAFRKPVLLWVTEWGIWPSSENWHLYYKLRQGYGDLRLLHEAPGHLFLEYEAEDLSSFLQLSMLNGWGGYVLTHANYVNAFFSHDEFIDLFGNDSMLNEVRKEFKLNSPPVEHIN
jgi:hypothetical protein